MLFTATMCSNKNALRLPIPLITFSPIKKKITLRHINNILYWWPFKIILLGHFLWVCKVWYKRDKVILGIGSFMHLKVICFLLYTNKDYKCIIFCSRHRRWKCSLRIFDCRYLSSAILQSKRELQVCKLFAPALLRVNISYTIKIVCLVYAFFCKCSWNTSEIKMRILQH